MPDDDAPAGPVAAPTGQLTARPGMQPYRRHGMPSLRDAGRACLVCGGSAECWDHCHAHGWVRGPVCRDCNGRLAHYDRGCLQVLLRDWIRAPRRHNTFAPPGAFLDHLARCPECPPWTLGERCDICDASRD